MAKKEIITITGTLGSGKSSTADLVAKKLGFGRFSSGDFMRRLAVEMGISLNELNLKAQADDAIDQKIDAEVRRAGGKDKIVIDSRLAFHWIPESFKVYLDLPPEIAKERILKNMKENVLRKQSEDSASLGDIHAKINSRLESERARYKKLYNIDDHANKNHFDLVVDTNKNNLEQVADMVIEEYKKWLAEN